MVTVRVVSSFIILLEERREGQADDNLVILVNARISIKQ